MSKEATNYEDLYSHHYVKLPKYIAGISMVVPFILAFLEVFIGTDGFEESYEGFLTFLVGDHNYSSAIFAGILWLGVIYGLYKALCFILSVSLSQKIVVVTRLTEIRDKE